VLYHGPSSRTVLNCYQIEPVLIPGPAVAQQPGTGNPSNVLLLSPADGFESTTARPRTAGFHFDEGHCATLPDNEIDIVTTQFEAMSFDGPAAGGEEGTSYSLALETEQLTRIFPLVDWYEPSGSAHRSQYGSRVPTENPAAAEWRVKLRRIYPTLFLPQDRRGKVKLTTGSAVAGESSCCHLGSSFP